jgi:hypothetical protein
MLFDEQNRLGSDECWINSQNKQSKDIHDYRTFNYFKTNVPDCEAKVNQLKDFVVQNNMYIKEGYGFTNACFVDHDTKLRNKQKITHGKCKNQLDTRIFHAVPDLFHGGFESVLESKLTQGESTGDKKSCASYNGKAFDVFTPLIPCLKDSVQSADHIIPKWVRGGEHTRDHVKQKAFLERNGYVMEGNIWKKKCD